MTSTGMIRWALLQAIDDLGQIQDHFDLGGKLPEDFESLLQTIERRLDRIRSMGKEQQSSKAFRKAKKKTLVP